MKIIEELQKLQKRFNRRPVSTTIWVILAIVIVGLGVAYQEGIRYLFLELMNRGKENGDNYETPVVVYTSLESKYESSELAAAHGERDSDFLSWLEYSFNEKYRRVYKVIIIRDTENSPSVERIRTAGRSRYFENIDVLLGGKPEVHELLPGRIVIDIDPDRYAIPEGAFAQDHRWVGVYLGCIGIIWNCTLVEPTWKPKIFNDLLLLKKATSEAKTYYLIPAPSTSSASYAFYFALCGFKERNSMSFEPEIAISKYNLLLTNGYIAQRGASAIDIISEGKALAGVEWLHDAFWKADILKRRYQNVHAMIPSNACLSLGCLSIFDRPKGNEQGALEFVRFFLETEVQKMHYELQKRMPIANHIREKVLVDDDSQFARAMLEYMDKFQEKMPISALDYFVKEYNDPHSAWVNLYIPAVENALQELKSIAMELPNIEASDQKLYKCSKASGWSLSSSDE